MDVLSRVGFTDVRVVERFDPFGGTSKERTARKYGVIGVNVLARKPVSLLQRTSESTVEP